MSDSLITCPSCGTQNRVPATGGTGPPVCGSCRSPLPVNALPRQARPDYAPSASTPLAWWRGASPLHKWAVGVGAFCVLWSLIVLLLWAPGGSSDAASIEWVLRQDELTAENVENVQQVVDKMRGISLRGCPPDFRQAYVAHIHAWEMMAEVERQAIEVSAHYSSGAAILESVIRGALGDPLGKAAEAFSADRQVQENFAYAQNQVRLTYQDVERVAADHGADLTR